MKKHPKYLSSSIHSEHIIYSGIFSFIVLFCFLVTLTTGCQQETRDAPFKKKSKKEKVDLEHFVLPNQRTSLKEALKLYVLSKKDRSNPEALIKASIYAMEHNDYSACEVLASRSLKFKESALGYSLRGRAIFNSFDNRDDEALEDLLTAARLGSTDSDDYIAISSIYDNRKQARKAIEYLTMGMKVSDHRDLYLSRATIYTTMGKYQIALNDYNKMLEMSPGYDRGHILRGQLHERLGNYEQALRDYEIAAVKNKDGEFTTIGIGARKLRILLFDKMGKHKRAINELKIALSESKDDRDEWLQLRGEQYTKLKEYDKAIADFNQAIKGSPRFARLSYLGRAKIYDLRGQKKKANQDRKKAEQLKSAPAEKTIY